jgi:phosphopantothenoylcysteine decarboxylase/phosphopantothenate--cysteine ligase
MAHILITSGPTRQYLDPVRYLTNASSGRMGTALATAALEQGHQVTIVSGPVEVEYPDAAKTIRVMTTLEMMDVAAKVFHKADGLIGAAAPCDYMPRKVEDSKMSKTGQPLQLELIETPDIVATLGASKRPDQWVVGFALETDDVRFRSIVKMSKKCCDMIVSNRADAMNADDNSVEIIFKDGQLLEQIDGPKLDVARVILSWIAKRLIKESL